MKILKYLIYLSPMIIFVIIVSMREVGESDLGSRSNPVKLYFTPSVDAKDITNNAKELVDFLEEKTGLYFTTAVPSSYVAVVEAFGTSKADIAIINTFSYLLSNEKYGAEARLRILRRNGESVYRGQIVVRTDSGIDSLYELQGRTIAYVDPSSTSGYILPKAMLEKRGIKTSDETFAMKHDNVITMVYQKQVTAGATFYSPPDPEFGIQDARDRVRKQFPDVEEKIKILALTEAIPNDPVVFRKGIDEELKDKIVEAMIEFISTEKGKEAFFKIYAVEGLTRTSDKDYDVLRDLLRQLNFSIEGLIK